jgi:hypothetical protein
MLSFLPDVLLLDGAARHLSKAVPSNNVAGAQQGARACLGGVR